MAFCVGKHEPLPAALARIADEQIHLARVALQRGADPNKVHNARKALKRLRALLKCLRPALPPAMFDSEDRRFFAAGQKLSPLRDVHVQLRTLAGCDIPGNPVLHKMRAELRRREKILLGLAPEWRTAAVGFLAPLALPWKTIRPADLAAGLKQIYKKGQAAARAAGQKPSPENLHRWRRRAKELAYGLELLQRIGSKKTGKMAGWTDKLAEALGEERDLFLIDDASYPAERIRG